MHISLRAQPLILPKCNALFLFSLYLLHSQLSWELAPVRTKVLLCKFDERTLEVQQRTMRFAQRQYGIGSHARRKWISTSAALHPLRFAQMGLAQPCTQLQQDSRFPMGWPKWIQLHQLGGTGDWLSSVLRNRIDGIRSLVWIQLQHMDIYTTLWTAVTLRWRRLTFTRSTWWQFLPEPVWRTQHSWPEWHQAKRVRVGRMVGIWSGSSSRWRTTTEREQSACARGDPLRPWLLPANITITHRYTLIAHHGVRNFKLLHVGEKIAHNELILRQKLAPHNNHTNQNSD